MINKKKSAFTLSEVLITITVIGVIAAITIPSIVLNIRNSELESSFKKRASELQNALNKVKFTESVYIYGEMSSKGQNDILNALLKQFGVPAKIIDRTQILSDRINKYKMNYKMHNGSNFTSAQLRLMDDGTLIVNDGFFIFLNNDNYKLTNQQFVIDTNGYKKPNREGYYLFRFCLNEGDKLNWNCDIYTKRAVIEKDYFKKLR